MSDFLRSTIREIILEMDLYGPDPIDADSLSADQLKFFDEITDTTLWRAASVFDPTGISSWPDFARAVSSYRSDPTKLNAVFLMISFTACIPVFGKFATVPRLAKATVTSREALKIASSASKLEKLKAIAGAIANSKSSWSELVQEIAPASGKFTKNLESYGVSITADEFLEIMKSAARILDLYTKQARYIMAVFGNAKTNAELWILDKFK